ncbi:MAG: hypothetical protein HeimC3_51870 [Candidatus Heimdallarchaeota archaeon LC_3]|nr:MAG: hypothetical protein HeimC3_51870 [Candidatus Heimdallarchaeota archaeon LC_3]
MVNFTFHMLIQKVLEPCVQDIKKEWEQLPQVFSECIGGMDLTIEVVTTFLNEDLINKISNIPTFITSSYPADENINTFFLLFDFKKISGPHPSLEHSIDGNRFFAVPIWDLTEEMSNNSNTVNIALMREYFTFITSFSKHSGEFPTDHAGECLRTYPEPVLPEDTRPMDRIKRLTEARYKNVPLKLCSTCVSSLCESFLNFLSQTSDAAEQLTSIKDSEDKFDEVKSVSSTKSEKPTEEYVPSYVSYSSQIQKQNISSESAFMITPEQKARINRIILELGIKEPVTDEFYLEIRERFLKGRLSEQAYRQHAKRFSMQR